MAVHFVHGRLHVGLRARDWSDVFYEPVGQETDDGGADIGLYKLTTGEAGYREPMEGEVKWHPWFDPNNCESKYSRERKRMQEQFLMDAWKYLAEQDPKKVARLDKELTESEPGFAKWQSWFKHAQKWKHKQLRDKERIRQRKTNGRNSDDSAYDSEGQEDVRRSRMGEDDDIADMPPPKRLNKGNGTNKAAKDLNASKKGKKVGRDTTQPYISRHSTPRMSGGLGASLGNGNITNGVGNHEPIFWTGSQFEYEGDRFVRSPDHHQPGPARLDGEWNFDMLTSGVDGNGIDDVNMANLQGGEQPDDDRASRYEREQTAVYRTEDDAVNEAIRRSAIPEDLRANAVENHQRAVRRSLPPSDFDTNQEDALDDTLSDSEQHTNYEAARAEMQPRASTVTDEDEGLGKRKG